MLTTGLARIAVACTRRCLSTAAAAEPQVAYTTTQPSEVEEVGVMYATFWHENPIMQAHGLTFDRILSFCNREIERAVDRRLCMSVRRAVGDAEQGKGELVGFNSFEDMVPDKFVNTATVFPEMHALIQNESGWRHRFRFWQSLEEKHYWSRLPAAEREITGRHLRVLSGGITAEFRKTMAPITGMYQMPAGTKHFKFLSDNATTVPSQRLAARVGMKPLGTMSFLDWEVEGVKPYADFKHAEQAILFCLEFGSAEHVLLPDE